MYRKIAFLSVLILWVSCSEKTETIHAQYTDMTISVYASVVVQPENSFQLFPEASGTVKKIYVSEGDTLSKGELIAVVEPVRENYDVKSAKLQNELARENLQGKTNKLKLIESEIKNLEAQLQIDSMNYYRQKKLWDQNIGAKVELENQKLKYTLTKENLAAAKEKYRLTKIELENQLAQSEVNYKRSRALLQNYDIRTPADAMVYRINKEEGESISRQEAFAELGDPKSFILEMQIDESDIASILPGQRLLVTLDAYPEAVYEAHISKIYPSKNLRTQSFLVEARFDSAPERLYAGLSGEANIIVATRSNILTVPLEYLTDNDKLLDADGNMIDVTIGHRNMRTVEILGGIDTTTRIQKP